MNYGFVIDTKSCIGCHACSTACKSENQVPVGVHRTWVKTTEKGRYPDVTRHFQVTRCNHCSNPPCVRSCPTSAMRQRNDGIVEFDSDACIGCKACLQACPYDAIYVDPDTKTAAKCHFCAHRIEVGLEPACVVVCPEHAILAGDLDDPNSEISRVIAKQPVTVRRPEQGTAPKLFYIEGNEVALHPQVHGGGFMYSDRHVEPPGPFDPPDDEVGRPLLTDRSAQAQGVPEPGPVQLGGVAAGHMVQVGWNAQHAMPWHWPIPTYLVTKAIAGGLFLLMAPLVFGSREPSGAIALAGLLGVALMAVTTGLLVYDLERPDRFLYLFLRPQWRSWVARAAWLLSAFFAVSALWTAVEVGAWIGLLGGDTLGTARLWLGPIAAPLGLLTGTYTAWLFAQAEGRDFWQSPATPLHMALQTGTLGAIGLLMLTMVGWDAGVVEALRWTAIAGLGAQLLTLWFGEFGVARSSEVATRVAREIVWGRWSRHFWVGELGVGLMVPMLLLLLTPYLAPLALIAAAAGMFAYEYAFVMAPQEQPNS